MQKNRSKTFAQFRASFESLNTSVQSFTHPFVTSLKKNTSSSETNNDKYLFLNKKRINKKHRKNIRRSFYYWQLAAVAATANSNNCNNCRSESTSTWETKIVTAAFPFVVNNRSSSRIVSQLVNSSRRKRSNRTRTSSGSSCSIHSIQHLSQTVQPAVHEVFKHKESKLKYPQNVFQNVSVFLRFSWNFHFVFICSYRQISLPKRKVWWLICHGIDPSLSYPLHLHYIQLTIHSIPYPTSHSTIHLSSNLSACIYDSKDANRVSEEARKALEHNRKSFDHQMMGYLSALALCWEEGTPNMHSSVQFEHSQMRQTVAHA